MCDRPGAAHSVPLIAQTPRDQTQGIRVTGFLGSSLMFNGDKARSAIARRKNTIFIEALPALARCFGIRPLLRSCGIENGITQAGDIKVAPTCGFTMFVKDVFNAFVREKMFGQRVVQFLPDAACELDNDLPVVTGLARTADRRTDVRDSSL